MDSNNTSETPSRAESAPASCSALLGLLTPLRAASKTALELERDCRGTMSEALEHDAAEVVGSIEQLIWQIKRHHERGDMPNVPTQAPPTQNHD